MIHEWRRWCIVLSAGVALMAGSALAQNAGEDGVIAQEELHRDAAINGQAAKQAEGKGVDATPAEIPAEPVAAEVAPVAKTNVGTGTAEPRTKSVQELAEEALGTQGGENKPPVSTAKATATEEKAADVPAEPAQVEAPAAEVKVEAPAEAIKAEPAPAAEVPAAEAKAVEVPAEPAQVEAPAAEVKVEAPAEAIKAEPAPAAVEVPAAEAKAVEVPAEPAKVEAPAAEVKVEAPAEAIKAEPAPAAVEVPAAEAKAWKLPRNRRRLKRRRRK